jgi:hypothetical protein
VCLCLPAALYGEPETRYKMPEVNMGSSIVTAMPVMDNPVSQHEQCLVTWATAQSGGDPVVLLAGWLPAWLSGWPESDVSACASAVCNCMHILLRCAASTVQSHPVDAKAHL